MDTSSIELESDSYLLPGSSQHVDSSMDTTGVFMGSGNLIQMPANEVDAKKRSIFSFGFDCCTGVGLYMLLKNNEQHAFLTHYPPADTMDHISKIKELCNKIKSNTDINPVAKAFAVIMHPLGWKKNPKTGYLDIKCPVDQQLVDKLTRTIKTLMDDIEISIELYDQNEMDGTYHPYGMYDDKSAPKEFEFVLSPSPQESYFQSKARWHRMQKFLEASK